MRESRHGDHVCSVRRGPLLRRNVLGACPSLYSGGGRPGRRNSEVVGRITRRGRERVPVLMTDPNLQLLPLPLHSHLPRSEGSGRKT